MVSFIDEAIFFVSINDAIFKSITTMIIIFIILGGKLLAEKRHDNNVFRKYFLFNVIPTERENF